MCNLYRLDSNPDTIRRLFAETGIRLEFPEGIPNLQPRDVRITDRAPVVRFASDRGVAELVERRWSWPGPGGKPVFNMRSDGREFGTNRCLAIANGFYEHTKAAIPSQKRKDCWLFEPAGEQPFAIAGLLRDQPGIGEAFTLLTVPPGPDVADYHQRQVALLSPPQWRVWLDGTAPSTTVLGPSVAGSLLVGAADR
jgi:putative SOS response-associated peptidase YedK